jgi:hypothetical protein
MSVAWLLPLWGATVSSRRATGRSRRCAPATAPAQGQPDVPRQTELVVCNQSIERAFAWKTRFRRLVRDYERRLDVLAGLLLVAFACLELARAAPALWLW